MRILLVDDEQSTLDGLRRLLVGKGHTISTSKTGREGLEKMRAEQPDLVLLDLRMPGELDGWEVAQRKRADPSIQAIPVIIVSGVPSGGIQQKNVEHVLSEINLVVNKPISPEVLDRAIAHIEGLKKIEKI